MVDAPRLPSALVSPDGRQILVARSPSYLDLSDLCRPELKLGGLRFDPARRSPSRAGYYTVFSLQALDGGAERRVRGLPGHARLGAPDWSPDGRYAAFTHCPARGAMQMWVLDSWQGRAFRLEEVELNGCFPTQPFSWLADSRTLVCRTVPRDGSPPPRTRPVPGGPVVQENLGVRAPARTLEDLLKSPDDERLFEYYLRSELVLAGVDGGCIRLPGVKLSIGVWPSPDGQYLLAESIHRPFSYALAAGSFPRLVEVLDRSGKTVHVVADLPLADRVPTDFDAVREGPRDVDWRSDVGAELSWCEACDGGDPRRESDKRDRLMALAAPFDGPPRVLLELERRLRGVRWCNAHFALVTESWWKTRRVVTWRVDPDGDRAPTVLFDRSSEDRYSDPGAPAMQLLSNGHAVIRLSCDGRALHLLGAGASPEGDRPFLDRLDLETGETTRLWRSEGEQFERIVRVLGENDDAILTLTSRESTAVTPNLWVREISAQGKLKPVTSFGHPAPAMATIQKEMIRYRRADGLQLSGTLYLPPGYKPNDGPLPVLMWAYPSEFKSAQAAGQIRESPYRFVHPWWGAPELFALRGFAVLDNPTFPIVGTGAEEPNDTYVEQLVSSARAAIQELERRGVGDPGRCAIGGHSYGAFTTANLLAHSDLFRAGIARSGAYNRTLTPFGFQAEERSFWEARDTYQAMSPFNYADKIQRPLLLIHGAEDDNSGTYPIQSERLYQALKGLGGTSRLVMLPRESHGYRARESIMHTLWEMDRWLKIYVDGRPDEPVDEPSHDGEEARA